MFMTRAERAARFEAEEQAAGEDLAVELAIKEMGWAAYKAMRDGQIHSNHEERKPA